MLFKKILNQKNQKQSQNPQQESLSEQLKNLSNTSPNLAPESASQTQTIKSRSSVIKKLSIILIFIIQALFVGLLLVNLSVSISNKALETSVEKLEAEVAQKKEIEDKGLQIIQRINIYKDLQGDAKLISQNVATIINQVPRSIEINSLEYKDNKIIVTGTAESALDFALLITKYLEISNVKEVALTSANLRQSAESREFVVVLEVVFI